MEFEPKIVQSWVDACRLDVGSTFIFKGDYCTVTALHEKYFKYVVQGDKTNLQRIMHYWFYLTTPSAKGRQVTRRF